MADFGIGEALSMASMAAGAVSTVTQGNAQAAGAGAAAQRAEYAAQAARVNANNTDAWYRDNLRTTLANIDAVRASAGVTPDSPTGQAIEAEQTRISDQQRTAKVVGLRAQANQDTADAEFYRQAAGTYGDAGMFKAGGGILDGLSQSSWFTSAVKGAFG